MKEIKVIAKRIDWSNLEAKFDSLLPTLYTARKEAVERLNNQKAKLASMATGLLLQEITKQELGIKPEELIISKKEQGKPYIVGYEDFCFNISHAGDMVAIAYGDSPVGIDIELVRCRENDLKVAKRCFAEEEYRFITEEAYELDMENISRSKEERFFMVWTMKEAYLKYKGTGISVPMKSFVVRPYENKVVGEKLTCEPVIINDYVYSVCVDEGVEVTLDICS
ncbi:MAG: 4'-phosphopantetheinyl transferase superfamily protein [Lachnospiraceae bacterium]|nr:4'-phosphopantetheinyl transferase superfamily protein [Lachnospiraceae bacterium]